MRLRVHGKLYFDWCKITARSDSFLWDIDHVCKYSLRPRTIIHRYHGNKNVAIFVLPPRVPNCMENLKGSWKFSFPKLFDSYRDSFLTAIVCNFRTFVGLFIFVIRYGSNHEMDIKRFQLFLLAKKTGKCTWYAHTFPPIRRIEGDLLNSTRLKISWYPWNDLPFPLTFI